MSQVVRTAYIPKQHEWSELFTMICSECSVWNDCLILEQMIEAKDGSDWPEGGWVTDPGSDVTCLSYVAKKRAPLPNDELLIAVDKAVPMCGGCAARKGSEASVSLHTQRDFKAAVEVGSQFCCHEIGSFGRPCGGWANAISKRLAEKKEQA